MNDERVFLGSVDDAVARNPWYGVPKDLDSLNRILVFLALFGSGPVFPFGNVAYNPNFSNSLFYPETSPLLDLAEAGFATLLTRRNSLSESVLSRLEQNHQHTKIFWEKLVQIKGGTLQATDYLSGISGPIYQNGGAITYTETDLLFDKLLSSRTSNSNSPRNVIINLIRSDKDHARDSSPLSRSIFESFFLKEPSFKTHETNFLQELNALKHVAHAKNLASNFPNLALETFPYAFLGEFEDYRTPDSDARLSAAEAQSLRVEADGLLRTLAAELRVPVSIFQDKRHWRLLAEALDVRNPSELKTAKAHLRNKVNGLLLGLIGGQVPSRQEMKACAASYNQALENALKLKTQSLYGLRILLGTTLLIGTAQTHARTTVAQNVDGMASDFISGVAIGLAFSLVFGGGRVERVLDWMQPKLAGTKRFEVPPDSLTICSPSLAILGLRLSGLT